MATYTLVLFERKRVGGEISVWPRPEQLPELGSLFFKHGVRDDLLGFDLGVGQINHVFWG